MSRSIAILVVALAAGMTLAAASIETTETAESVLFTED